MPSSPPPFLTTPRLRLRPFADTDADLDRLTALDNDPGVMRFLNGGKPVPRDTVRDQNLPRLLHDYPCLGGRGDRGYWAAEERETGAFLGWFEFRPLAEDCCAEVELGYRLRRAAWGHGYATEGARALLRTGFTQLGVQRVTADTMAVNAASRHVMEKAGLTFQRVLFPSWPEAIEGSERGEVEYALTRADWLGAD